VRGEAAGGTTAPREVLRLASRRVEVLFYKNSPSPGYGTGAGQKKGRVAMATTVSIECPGCHKQMKAPAELLGKKVRCKACGHTFPARARGPAPAKPPAGQPAAAKAKRPLDDEEDDSNPYTVSA